MKQDNVLEGLKNFQIETVNSVIDRFNNGQNKVLVADEVGLGKTLIARGVISQLLKQKRNNKIFNVVYICSNQSIASQNMRKLAINENAISRSIGDRLSMQSLNIYNQNLNRDPNSNMQIIPLTPETSFYIKSRRGNVAERALIYATLCRIPEFKKYKNKFKRILTYPAKETFEDWVKEKREKIEKSYIDYIHDDLIKKISETTVQDGIRLLDFIENNRIKAEDISTGEIVKQLRIIFSELGLEMLKPDLVIMDEFQKFKDLIGVEQESETNLIAKKFFNKKNLKILLLSATPYTLYATQEELQQAMENNNDAEYDMCHKEFMDVMNFIFEENKFEDFKRIWNNHSKNLYSINGVKFDDLKKSKKEAEDAMYQAISRTERNHLIDKEAKRTPIEISELDIKSYLQMANIVDEMKKEEQYRKTLLTLDYVKSCPYVLSFAISYKLKEQIKDYLLNTRKSLKNTNLLLLDENTINNYQSGNIMKSNARLNEINNVVFKENIQNLLWLPPTKNYYALEKPFKNIQNNTKTIIFSKWEMVPRMISTLFSYEVEQKIYKDVKYNETKKRGRIREEEFPSWLLLLYPSQKLSKLYNPIENLNNKNVKKEVYKEFEKITKAYTNQTYRAKKFHYLFPLIVDDEEYVEKWFETIKDIYPKAVENLKKEYNKYKENPSVPDTKNFREIMTNYIIASPANCIYRNLGDSKIATQIAKNFVKLFNGAEATAILDKCYNIAKEQTYWKRVLSYCYAGNLQAVIDEYFYMITECNCLENNQSKNNIIKEIVGDAMNLNTATYNVDMTTGRKKVVTNKMRAHFAMGFSRGDSSLNRNDNENESTNRTESIRTAFNSPFWPFVLASTSIGQEGLDFHYYCKRIVHWNLPSNPINLEQREGRIDRFKSLAIREYVAKKNVNAKFERNIWKEMFENVEKDENDESGLCPNWCLKNNEKIDIERIIPMYPLSEDINKYNRAENILELYRLTLGQERQEDLLINILESDKIKDQDLKELFIDLCPWNRKK